MADLWKVRINRLISLTEINLASYDRNLSFEHHLGAWTIQRFCKVSAQFPQIPCSGGCQAGARAAAGAWPNAGGRHLRPRPAAAAAADGRHRCLGAVRGGPGNNTNTAQQQSPALHVCLSKLDERKMCEVKVQGLIASCRPESLELCPYMITSPEHLKPVQAAVQSGRVTDVIGTGAGQWPAASALSFARLALRCPVDPQTLLFAVRV